MTKKIDTTTILVTSAYLFPETAEDKEARKTDIDKEREAESKRQTKNLSKDIKNYFGKTITSITLHKQSNELAIIFSDKTSLVFWDDGQSCCEHRYMHTDDDLKYFAGGKSKLISVEVRTGPCSPENPNCDYKESQFLIITTSRGSFTVVNYNEHNGYYGGFVLKVRIS